MSALTPVPEDGQEFLQCVHRVADLPVIAAAFDGARGFYDKIKHAPVPFLGRTLDAAEATVGYAAAQVYPMALKLERPIHYMDSLACKSLDIVEENVPIVKETPDKILTDAKTFLSQTTAAPLHFVSNVKSYGVTKVGEATEYGRDKVIRVAMTSYGQHVLQSFDSMVGAVDAMVDKYLPGQEREKVQVIESIENEDKWDPALVPVAHAAGLLIKILRRIYNLTLPKAHAAQKKCTDAIDELSKQPAEAVDFVRTKIASGTHSLSEVAKNVWEGNGASNGSADKVGKEPGTDFQSAEQSPDEEEFESNGDF